MGVGGPRKGKGRGGGAFKEPYRKAPCLCACCRRCGLIHHMLGTGAHDALGQGPGGLGRGGGWRVCV